MEFFGPRTQLELRTIDMDRASEREKGVMSEQGYYESNETAFGTPKTRENLLLHKRVLELRRSEFSVRKVISVGTAHKPKKILW